MGSQCIKPASKSILNSHLSIMDSLQHDLKRCQQKLHFTMTIEHLKLTNMTEKIKQIKFSIENQSSILYKLSQFNVQESLIKSQKIHKTQFNLPAKELYLKRLLIQLIGDNHMIIETLNLKLIHLCTGPVHHDHLLKQLKARLMFDLNLYQTVKINSKCKNFKINLNQNQGETSFQDLSYRLTLTTAIDQNIFTTEQKYLTSLQQGTNTYQQSKLSVHIANNLLKQANYRIQIIKSPEYFLDELAKVIHSIYIPYRKIQNYQTFISMRKNDIQYVKKNIQFNQVLKQNDKIIGSVSFNLDVESSIIYTEQMQGLIFSQIGVSSVSPTISQQSHDGLIKQLRQIYKNVKKLKNTITQERQALISNLDDIYINIQKSNEQIFTSHQQLYQRQITLVKLLNQLSTLFTQGSDILNQRLWRTINYIVHRPQLSTRYLSLHQNQITKKQLYIKYYQFIIQVLSKIIICTQTGITFHELQCIQKFIAFAYFRFPWIQKKILDVWERQSDPIISEEKLIQFGAHRGNKSPSKSYVYDWEINIYKKISNEKQFQLLLNKLQQIQKKYEQWDRLLFNRKEEDLFYGLYLEIWNQAQFTLKNIRGNILWEYFPNYGPLISCFLGEMNSSKISDYSSLFKLCSNKLVLNQKLLNTFVVQLFPKTYLLQISCVLRCLNLLQSYFEVLIKRKKKLPHDFHFNYFYTGIKSIIQQNHSYLVVKTLYILYNYYQIFTMDFKKTINNFLLSSKIFYQLFLHWCSNVRKMFYHLIYHKILQKEKKLTSNPQDMIQMKKQNNFSQANIILTPKNNNKSTNFDIQLKYIQSSLSHLSKSQKKSLSPYRQLKQNFTQQVLFDRKLHKFLHNIQNQSNSIRKQKQLQNKNIKKSTQYHQRMRQKLKQRKRKYQQSMFKKQNNFLSPYKITYTQNYDQKQQHQNMQFISRKHSQFVKNQIYHDQTIKIRKMSATDQAYFQKIQSKYKNYCTISLKQYEMVKKNQNPAKEVEKLAKLVQGDIDS